MKYGNIRIKILSKVSSRKLLAIAEMEGDSFDEVSSDSAFRLGCGLHLQSVERLYNTSSPRLWLDLTGSAIRGDSN